MNYLEFLQSKIDIAEESGFEIDPAEVNPALKPHQRDAVVWAIKGGRRALFESFGLGKTAQQLEWARLIHAHTGARALIILPLGVKQEFQLDAVRLLGWKDAPPYVRTDAEAQATDAPVVLTNYERVRDGDLNPRTFGAVSLDEASCMRSFGSKTYQEFLKILKGIRYKLVCTATPSPNRYKELIHYAGYLEIMDTGQALTRFFQRDSTKANNLTLYPHRENDFWLWVSLWALFIQKPSDLGYDDTGYDLPETVLLCVSGTNGEIRGSFICREIEDATMWGPARIAKAACITTDEAEGYKRKARIKGRRLYAWKVDDMRAGGDVLSIYDYGATRPPQSWCYTKARDEG